MKTSPNTEIYVVLKYRIVALISIGRLIFMAVSKPLLTEFGIHHELCPVIQFYVDVSEKNCFIFLLAEVALGCHQRLDHLVTQLSDSFCLTTQSM